MSKPIQILLHATLLLGLWSMPQSSRANAPTEAPLLLRSTQNSGGEYSWNMCSIKIAGTNGAEISAVGFTNSGWTPAIVPGTVLNSLVANGTYPEPYFGLNNAHEQKLIPDISEVGREFYTYWFRTEFLLPNSFRGRQAWLQFDGINYRAEVWLNGQRLGELAGMFQRGIFNATAAAHCGATNALAVLIRPVDHPGSFRQKSKTIRAAGENKNGGDGEIGRDTTMLMTVGWDFTFTDGIRDRNTGIWRDVKIFATGPVGLRNASVEARLPLPELAPARETLSVDLVNATTEPQTGTLEADIREAGIKLQQQITLQPGETRTVQFTPENFPQLIFAQPKLWWPFNKGEQFLYHLTVDFVHAGQVSDRITTRFGIRDVRSNRNTPDKSRQFLVNGHRFFLHGSNWIPEAMCRTSRERTEAELRYTRQSGVNFLRQWGGGVTESDDFYDLCDELGILVWTEFWQTGDTRVPQDRELYRANVTDTIRRIRSHPSQAYYVSANERDSKSIIPIADLIQELHPTCEYQVGSETDGIHDGSPYIAENPMFYYEDTASPRGSRINGLCPEYGCPALPTVDCLRELMPEKDLWPPNKVMWDYLDGGGFHQMTKNFDRCVQQYGASKSIDEYALKAQAFGGLAWRAIWECWNANKFDFGDRFSTGLLFWYHNSPNRQVCGRMWDWSLEPTSALYFTQDALEPLHAQFDFLKNTVSVNNELPRAFTGTIAARVFDLQMREVFRKTAPVTVPAEGFTTNIFKIDFPKSLKSVHFLKLDLGDDHGKPVSDTFYWRSAKAYQPGRTWTGPQFEGFEELAKLPKVKLQTTTQWEREDTEHVVTVHLKNPSKALAFLTWLRLQYAKDAKPVRPAFYEDNYVSLLPGETRTIKIRYHRPTGSPQDAIRLLVDGWNIEPQISTPTAATAQPIPQRGRQ